jgi:hypothetical protein
VCGRFEDMLKQGEVIFLRSRKQSMTPNEIETPALCVDLDILDKNLQRMGAMQKSTASNWAPRAKIYQFQRSRRLHGSKKL